MIFVGDWVPGTKQGILKVERDSTIFLANLEGPLLQADHRFSPTAKAGPSLFSVSLAETNHSFVFALANNHIMDYGKAGLRATQEVLNQRKTPYMGAGFSQDEARRPLIIEEQGKRLGIISCCEAQFGVAHLDSHGVAEMGPWLYTAIDLLKRETDAVIISVHAAVEDSPWASPRLQDFYRSLINAGASVVHGHHAHVPQGIETYNDGIIMYGLGNFLVDPAKWYQTPNALWSLGVEIDFNQNPFQAKTLVFEIDKDIQRDVCSVCECSEENQAQYTRYLALCNLPLKNRLLLEALWQETALRAFLSYAAGYMGFPGVGSQRHAIKPYLRFIKGKCINMVRSLAKVPIKQFSQANYLLWHLMFACESHRDTLATALGVLGGEIQDLRTEETRQMADELMPWSVGSTNGGL